MTNYQNRRRWAIRQQELARRLNAVKVEIERRTWWPDWVNMFQGNAVEELTRKLLGARV